MWTKQQMTIALVVVVAIGLAAYFGYRKMHEKKGGFRVFGHEYPRDFRMRKDSFGDQDNWPGSGVFGNLSDTNPYGNYADSQSMYWPTMFEYGPYYTLS